MAPSTSRTDRQEDNCLQARPQMTRQEESRAVAIAAARGSNVSGDTGTGTARMRDHAQVPRTGRQLAGGTVPGFHADSLGDESLASLMLRGVVDRTASPARSAASRMATMAAVSSSAEAAPTRMTMTMTMTMPMISRRPRLAVPTRGCSKASAAASVGVLSSSMAHHGERSSSTTSPPRQIAQSRQRPAYNRRNELISIIEVALDIIDNDDIFG
mmetsp:Transcript_19152/g.54402  ORF Transcript_19152/g.54402 Transcript_19152/m.54402 type:complete len:214 (-) Transcript_19152:477-1118(-)